VKRDARLRVLLCGGLDPTARAGLLADVAAVRAGGAVPLAVATALTAQGGPAFVSAPVRPAILRAQLRAVLAAGPVHAVKLGVVPDAAALKILRAAISPLAVPVVMDPVVHSSKGERLSRLTPGEVRAAGAWVSVLTPNREELEWLGVGPSELLWAGFGAVVVKGSQSAIDVLHVRGRAPVVFRRTPLPRISPDHRGTGCRFASSLATALAAGRSFEQSTRVARSFVRAFLKSPML
jgi:hydroxymethylpyrimidine/phosphomethylpyrimidine kinase